MRILHLSDFHLDRVDAPNADGIDARGSLRRMLEACAHVEAIDPVVVSGDIADDGSAEAYAAAARLIGGFASIRGAPQVYSVGNHDQRAGFAQVPGIRG